MTPIESLRRSKGFALFWWWRGWVAVGWVAFRLKAPAWVVNLCGAIASW